MKMEKIHKNMLCFHTRKLHQNTCSFVFVQLVLTFARPPLHHNGKGSILLDRRA